MNYLSTGEAVNRNWRYQKPHMAHKTKMMNN